MPVKNNTGGGRGRDYCSNVVHSDILPKIIVNGDPASKTPTNERKLTDAASLLNEPSTVDENATDSMSCVWESLEAKGIPPEAREIMLQSWRKSTRDQYDVHFRKWMLSGNNAQRGTEVSIQVRTTKTKQTVNQVTNYRNCKTVRH